MVKQRESEFGIDSITSTQETLVMDRETEPNREIVPKLYTIDGAGKDMCIKEVPYFSEEAKCI